MKIDASVFQAFDSVNSSGAHHHPSPLGQWWGICLRFIIFGDGAVEIFLSLPAEGRAFHTRSLARGEERCFALINYHAIEISSS